MGISTISIILYHQTWITSGIFFEWIHLIGYIGVEVFLFLSGFGIAHSLKKNTLRQYYKNRIIRLVPVCLIYGLLKICLSIIPTMPKCQNLFLDLFSLSHWYIYAIVIYYLSAPVIYKIADKRGMNLLLVVCILSFVIVYFWQYDSDAPYLIKYGRWVVKRLPVFVFGMLIALKPLKWKLLQISLFGMIIFIMDIVSLHYIILANANPMTMNLPIKLASLQPNRTDIPDNGRYLLDMLSVLFLCPFFSLIAYLAEKCRVLPFIRWIGIYSLEIYLCHQYIFKVLLEHWDYNPYVELAIGIIMSFTVAYIIRMLSNPIKDFVAKNIL